MAKRQQAKEITFDPDEHFIRFETEFLRNHCGIILPTYVSGSKEWQMIQVDFSDGTFSEAAAKTRSEE